MKSILTYCATALLSAATFAAAMPISDAAKVADQSSVHTSMHPRHKEQSVYPVIKTASGLDVETEKAFSGNWKRAPQSDGQNQGNWEGPKYNGEKHEGWNGHTGGNRSGGKRSDWKRAPQSDGQNQGNWEGPKYNGEKHEGWNGHTGGNRSGGKRSDWKRAPQWDGQKHDDWNGPKYTGEKHDGWNGHTGGH